jgi:pimeloyl-ACP methyl ester carboxylesterase
MNTPLAVLAALLSVLALYLPTRTQAFTRVIVDGRSIRMLVAGRGDAAVVFENGLGGPLEHWGKVQPDVSRFARTVAYDRAGIGLSNEGPRPRDGRRIAAELRHALRTAGIAPPYIVVGASLGGSYIRIFAGMYLDDVAGLVLVDPTPDNEQVDDAAGLPGRRPVRRSFSEGGSLGGGGPELESLSQTLDQARASRVPIGIPVFLIDAISPLEVPFATEAIRTLRMSDRAGLKAESLEYRKWLDTIPGSRLIVTNRSGHNVAQEQPDLVVATIRQVVDEATRRSQR